MFFKKFTLSVFGGVGIVPFLLCEIRLKACTFNLCAETGQVFALSCEPSIAAGASCP